MLPQVTIFFSLFFGKYLLVAVLIFILFFYCTNDGILKILICVSMGKE